MTQSKLIQLLISLHKKVNVNALSDEQWREYQLERRDMQAALDAQSQSGKEP